jgi:uncharacterized protein
MTVGTGSTAGHLEGLSQGRLLIAECTGCRSASLPPRLRCTECGAQRFRWVAASGRGRLWSYVEFHKSYSPTFKIPTPYVVAVIELDEGPLIYSNMLDDYADLEAGRTVQAGFEDTERGPELFFHLVKPPVG